MNPEFLIDHLPEFFEKKMNSKEKTNVEEFNNLKHKEFQNALKKIDVFGSNNNDGSSTSLERRRGSKRRYKIKNKTETHNKRQRLELQSRLATTRFCLFDAEDDIVEKRRRASGRILEPLWWIPFNYLFGSRNSTLSEAREFWLCNRTIRFVDVGMTRKEYFLANPNWIYPYRVNYDVENWKMIISQVFFKKN